MTDTATVERADVDRPDPAGKPDVWIMYWIWPAFYTAFGIIFVALGRVMPPPRPDKITPEVVEFFSSHALTIQIGFALLLVLVGGAAVTNGMLMYHMKRMTSGSVFAYTYMAAMAVGALPGCLLVGICFLTATFRTDRNPELLQLLYDLGMLSYNGSLGCFNAAYFGLALAILYDKNNIVPKWFAYLTIWQIVTEIMATQMFVSKAGPFAWNGSMSFWLGTFIFTVWLMVLITVLKKVTADEPFSSPPLP